MSGLLEILDLILGLLRRANNILGTVQWSANALLDLFLHAAWSAVAALAGLWLAYWAVRGLYFVLAPGGSARAGDQGQQGLSFALTKRVVWLCVLAQFLVDILGHAYAVFRQGLPVTLETLGKYAARDFHAEAWVLSLAICLAFGVHLVIRLIDTLKHSSGEPDGGLRMRLGDAMRRFSYTVALFGSLSAHMWWDRLLSFG